LSKFTSNYTIAQKNFQTDVLPENYLFITFYLKAFDFGRIKVKRQAFSASP